MTAGLSEDSASRKWHRRPRSMEISPQNRDWCNPLWIFVFFRQWQKMTLHGEQLPSFAPFSQTFWRAPQPMFLWASAR